MAVNERIGRSVYCSPNPKEKIKEPLYVAARQLVSGFHSKNNLILDLGCSDMAASLPLIENGESVIGVDLSYNALNFVHKINKSALIIQGNLEAPLPINPNAPIDCILLLDILEHLSKKNALNLLINISEDYSYRPLSLIISMPICSPSSFPCMRELLDNLVKSGHIIADMGIFDRTHVIFGNRNTHKELFKAANYAIVREEVTCGEFGVTGMGFPAHPISNKRRFLKQILRSEGDFSNGNNKNRDNYFNHFGYQGLYVIRPL